MMTKRKNILVEILVYRSNSDSLNYRAEMALSYAWIIEFEFNHNVKDQKQSLIAKINSIN